MPLHGIPTSPRRLTDGPNRAQRRAKKTRNPNDGRDQAIHAGRQALRTHTTRATPANRQREARARAAR